MRHASNAWFYLILTCEVSAIIIHFKEKLSDLAKLHENREWMMEAGLKTHSLTPGPQIIHFSSITTCYSETSTSTLKSCLQFTKSMSFSCFFQVNKQRQNKVPWFDKVLCLLSGRGILETVVKSLPTRNKSWIATASFLAPSHSWNPLSTESEPALWMHFSCIY